MRLIRRVLMVLAVFVVLELGAMVSADIACAAVKPPGPDFFTWLGGGRVQWFSGALNALVVWAKPWEDPTLQKWYPWEPGQSVPKGAIVRLYFWGESNYPNLEGSELKLELNNQVGANGKAEGWEKILTSNAGFCTAEIRTANRQTGPQVCRIYYDSKRGDVVNAVGGFIFMLQPLLEAKTTTPPEASVTGLPAGVQIVTHPAPEVQPPVATVPGPAYVPPTSPTTTGPVTIPSGMAAIHVVTSDGQTASVHIEVNGVEVAARSVDGIDYYFMVSPGYVRLTADPHPSGRRWMFAKGTARALPVSAGQTLEYTIHLGR